MLGVAIDKYSYITCRYLPPFFKHKHRIAYSKIENVSSINEIQHPSVRETLKYFRDTARYFEDGIGFEIHHDGDIPARSGMGSSSSFTVGLIKSLYALKGSIITKEELYREAIHIEQNLIKENVGSQDQVWAAVGGLNLIEFLANGKILVKPIIMKEDRLRFFENKLMLFFTGLSRTASEIAGEQIRNIPKKKNKVRPSIISLSWFVSLTPLTIFLLYFYYCLSFVFVSGWERVQVCYFKPCKFFCFSLFEY